MKSRVKSSELYWLLSSKHTCKWNIKDRNAVKREHEESE